MKTPFTSEQFFSVFEKYNLGVFPNQIIIAVIGIGMLLFLTFSSFKLKHMVISVLLGSLWIWTGSTYHIGYFSAINKVAYAFGALFILQGVFLLFSPFFGKTKFKSEKLISTYMGYGFMFFGLLIYPLISYFQHQEVIKIISLGLPCPDVIVTLGFFMMIESKYLKYLLIIPALWSIIGISAAVYFGVYQDLTMIFGAFITFWLIINKNKTQV